MFWTVAGRLALIAVISYLIGEINGSIITSKYLYKRDIRDYGSGNAGLTNFYRVFGKYGAALVILIDILKAVVPVLFAGWLMGLSGMSLLGRAFSGFFVMFGHAFPAVYGFKGGKTVLTGGTVLWLVDWRVALLAWGVFLLIAVFTRYVSLGSILAGALYPVGMLVFGVDHGLPFIMTALSGALLIFCHRANIKRLIEGKESKFSFKRK